MHDQAIPELDRRGLRHFGLVTGGIVAGLFGLIIPWLLSRPLPLWPWLVLGVLALWALVAPMGLRPVYRAWMRFGQVMGRITTPIVLGVLFYFVVSPMAITRWLLGKDSMRRSFDPGCDTYRLRSKKAKVENLKRPF